MKKKFWVIVFAAVAALCMCVGLAACGRSGSSQSGSSQSGSSQSGSSQSGSSHVHSYGEWQIVTPATHLKEGTRRKYCSCGTYLDEKIPKKTAHEYGNWKTTREATHLVAGEKQRTCPCGAIDTEIIPKTAEHTFLPYSHRDATCTEAGDDVLRCECGEEQHNPIPPSHTYDHCKCTVCGAIEPGAVAVGVYVDNKLQDTVYTNAEYDYKIELPAVQPDWAVDKSISRYFDGWYTDEDYTTLATGNEVYHEPSAIYGQQYICDRWGFDCTFSNNEATISKVYLKLNNSGYATTIFIPPYANSFPITGIAAGAFAGQTTIRYLFLSDNLRTIGGSAFSGCNSMLKIFFSEGLTTIGSSAFSGCSGLTSIEIPDSVTSIGDRAFYWCTGLQNIEIPAGVTSIGSSAFSGCSGLERVTFGAESKLKSIGNYAFSGCTGLASVIWNAENCTTAGNGSYPIFEGCTNLQTVTFGDNVKTIPSYAFYGCTGLKSVTFGAESKLESIGDDAFCHCEGLQSIEIPDSVTSIGDDAFYGCTGLTSIVIPDSVTSIGSYAFLRCSSLSNVTFANPNNWRAGDTPIASSSLAKPDVAATYLTRTYCDYTWKRNG